MALKITDSETERLVAEFAQLTGESKTAAVRTALRERRQRLLRRGSAEDRHERLQCFLEEEVWPLIPPGARGGRMTKAEREEILGYGPDGY